MTWLKDLRIGKVPQFGANANDWTLEVRDLLGALCTAQVNGATVKAGDAAQEYVRLAEDKYSAKTATLEDYKMPVRFAWLLTGASQELVKTRRLELMEKEKKDLKSFVDDEAAPAKGKKHGAAASSSSASGSSSSAAGAKKQKTELDVALATFGR